MKLKWEKDDSIKTGLARAKGLGAAGEGSTTWIHERVSAFGALLLCLWLACQFMAMPDWGYETFTSWLAVPLNSILMILSIMVVFYHTALGCKVIVEDYFHHEGFKFFKLMGIDLFFLATAVACIFSVLKIAFAG